MSVTITLQERSAGEAFEIGGGVFLLTKWVLVFLSNLIFT